MHVNFEDSEDIPLQSLQLAGTGQTASVDIVRCRQVRLARKIVRLPPSRKVNQQVLQEVQALYKLSHPHVVRLVGTYIRRRHFATLLYPAAEMNLEEYLQEVQENERSVEEPVRLDFEDQSFAVNPTVRDVLSKGTLCLTSGLRYLHNSGINHSDIKPANIILKNTTKLQTLREIETFVGHVSVLEQKFIMYFCDFGISRTLDPEGESQTEEDRGKTPRYAPPEVMEWESHGRAADIYSLGYVLAEMSTVHSGRLTSDFRKSIQPSAEPFQAYYKQYLPRLIDEWFSVLGEVDIGNSTIKLMLHEDPNMRSKLISDPDNFVIFVEYKHEAEKFPGCERDILVNAAA